MGHLDVNEADYSGLKPVFRSFHHNNEFLLHLRSDFNGNAFLQFLRNWVLNEPAVELNLGILDKSAILVLEWQFFTVVLPKNVVTLVALLS